MSDEPLLITDDLAREWLNDSMRLSVCIRNDRGYCCSYHEGFEDALGVAQAWQEERTTHER